MSSTLKDPRERTLTWLETYFTTANVTDDNSNTTLGLMMYEESEFPVELVFIDLYRDYVITVGDSDLEPLRNADKTVHSYRENVPLTVSLFDRGDLTGTKVKWKIEAELRRIAETYLFGSVRLVTARQPKTQFLGNERMHSFTYELSYVRDKT
jgi:hypothetical protein